MNLERKQRVLGMFFKLDLQKVYDHANRKSPTFYYSFFKLDLGRRGWNRFILHLFGDAFYVGESDPCGFFGSLRNLRKGDPLSLMLMMNEVVLGVTLMCFSVEIKSRNSLIVSYVICGWYHDLLWCIWDLVGLFWLVPKPLTTTLKLIK